MRTCAAARHRSSVRAMVARAWWIVLVAAVAMWSSSELGRAMTIEQCVPVEGATGWLGIHVAILRVSPSCAAGELAVGATPGQLTRIAIAIAVPLVLVNLLAMAAFVGGVRLVALALYTVGRILRVLFVVPRPTSPSMPVPEALPRRAVDRPRWARPVIALPARRGPPSLAVA